MTFRTESPVEVETGVFDSLESCRAEAKKLLGEYWASFSAAVIASEIRKRHQQRHCLKDILTTPVALK